jgi:hydantoinase/carbamoylase family amidase
MIETALADVAVAAARVQDRLRVLGALTGGKIDRSGWSLAETAAHELVAGWMGDAGLVVFRDPAGNLHGARPGTVAGASEIWSGSHLDTVPGGGLYDGALGVLVALEAIELLGPRPLGAAVIAWRDEEGTRFGLGCNGARALVGRLSPEQLALTDADGVTLAEAIAAVGASVGEGWAMRPPAAYLEVHIEQGPILAEAGLSAAVVTGAVARVRLDVRIDGAAGHAATPLARRRDAGVAAAQLMLDVRALAAGQDQAVATVGAVTLMPGARNVVPERAELFLDMRAPTDRALDHMLSGFHARAEAAAAAQGCTVATVVRQHEPAVTFDHAVLDALRAHLGPAAPELVSWGGHDALIVAQAGVPTAMLYLASGNDGAAHSPREHTDTAVVADGIEILHRALLELTAGPSAVTVNRSAL